MAIPVVVVTGGPCGGRSTFMVRAREWFEKNGYCVFVIPETAMELIMAGASPAVLGSSVFQERLLRYTLVREENYREMARELEPQKIIILCDRGVLDCATYMGFDLYRRMISELGHSHFELMGRYDYVVHLVTAARGAEESYAYASATARLVSPDEARIIDGNAATAWHGHRHHILVDNSTGFNRKIFRALYALSKGLGIPQPSAAKRTYRVTNFTEDMVPKDSVTSLVVEDYLVSFGASERRIRKRFLGAAVNYVYSEKLPTVDGTSQFERELQISQQEYQQFLVNERDSTLWTVERTCHVFACDGKLCELEVYGGRRGGLALCSGGLHYGEQDHLLPEGWEGDDVTTDARFTHRALAEPTTSEE